MTPFQPLQSPGMSQQQTSGVSSTGRLSAPKKGGGGGKGALATRLGGFRERHHGNGLLSPQSQHFTSTRLHKYKNGDKQMLDPCQ